MPRQKKVFRDSAEVCHQWAARWNEPDSFGRNPHDNLRFRGPILISYATAIGRIFAHPSHGTAVVFLSEHDYSVTTAGQLRDAASATRHLNVYRVGSIMLGPEDERSRLVALADEARSDFERNPHKRRDCRAKQWDAWRRAAVRADRFAAAFGLERVAIPTDPTQEQELERVAARDRVARVERERKRSANAERRAAEWEERSRLARRPLAERISAWRAGQSVQFGHSELNGDMLRVRGSRIETSRGAVVPTDDIKQHAAKILRAIDYATRSGKQMTLSSGGILAPMTFGPFTLRSITADGTVEVGCHSFRKAEIIRLGKTLGIVPATDDTIPADRRIMLHPESATRHAVDALLAW